MAASKVEICNLALANANLEASIMDFDVDQTEGAARCRQWYEVARRASLVFYDWTFARKFAVLAKHSDEVPATSGFWFSQRYECPLDCLAIREVRPFGPDDRQLPHKQEIAPNGTRSLLTNVAEQASIRYTFDQTDTFLFSPLFDIALGLFLGSYLAEPLTGKMSKRRELLLEAQGMMMQAAESDKNTDQDEPERDASWIQERSAFGFGLNNQGGANNVFTQVQNLRAATGSSLAVR